MIILTVIIICLLIERNKERNYRNQLLSEKEQEIDILRSEMWDLKVQLISSNTGKDFSYLLNKKKDEP